MIEIVLNKLSLNQTGKHSTAIFTKQVVSLMYALNKNNKKLAPVAREILIRKFNVQ